MKITYTEWKMIESAAKDAQTALEALQDRLIGYAFDHIAARHQEEADFLIKLANAVSTIASAKELMPYFYHPQPEWVGGDCFRTREPHIVGSFPAYLEGE